MIPGSRSTILLEYLKILLSTQMVAGACLVLILLLFKNEIRDLIKRIRKFKAPGGGEFSASSQVEKEEDAPISEDIDDNAIPTPAIAVADPPDVELGELKDLLRNERATSVLWEYRYLNYYLANGTILVLSWFSNLNPSKITVRSYDSWLSQFVPDPSERSARLTALTRHFLIIQKDDLLEISPKGREYLQWRANVLPETAA